MDILKFWQLTPFEFALQVRSYNKLKQQEYEEKITLTYLGAYWQRVKRMPSINEIIKKPKKKMTASEMLEEIKKINNAMGGEVK